MPTTINDQCAIVGVGQTEFSKDSGRSELQLTLECTKAAMEDAGLPLLDVDGMVTLSIDGSDEIAVMRGFGTQELQFFSRVPHGIGGIMGMVHQAVMAITTGMCKTVLVYRAINGHTGRQPSPTDVGGPLSTDHIHWSWYNPFGFSSPMSWAAMYTQRYMYEYGATSDSLAEIVMTMRKHAMNNPNAIFQQPLSKEEYEASPLVVEPLRKADCGVDLDGGCAFVITSIERAKDLPHPPAIIRAAAQGSAMDQEAMTSFYRDDITRMSEYDLVAKQCYEMSGLKPDDIDVAMLYDMYTSAVLFQLESYGFCKPGEAHEFVKNGALGIDGRLPCNTNGGQLGEGHIQGVNNLLEAVRLIRGTSVNQPKKSDHVLAASGFGVPASAVILGKSH